MASRGLNGGRRTAGRALPAPVMSPVTTANQNDFVPRCERALAGRRMAKVKFGDIDVKLTHLCQILQSVHQKARLKIAGNFVLNALVQYGADNAPTPRSPLSAIMVGAASGLPQSVQY